MTAVGNFKEALLSLNTYIELVGKAKERIAKGGVEKDSDDDQTIILTVEEGIRVLCKYLNNGKRAMEIAELLEEWLEEWGVVSSEEEAAESTALHRTIEGSEEKASTISVVKPEVLCAAWRGIGVATSHWARQTVDAAKRPEIQQGAEDAFRKGLEYDEEDVDCLFGLAMVLAETRHIDDAVTTIKQALVGLSHLKSEGEELAQEPEEEEAVAREYRRLAVPFWHLLSLLLSASEEFEGALRVCDAVFEELGGEDNLRMAHDVVDQGDPLRGMIMKMGPDEKENILEVKMTQMALVELMEGPDAAINMSDELLKLYNTLFYSNNLEEQIIKVQQSKVQQVQEQFKGLEVEEKPSRLRSMSRYSKFGRSHHKKHDSSAVSVMAGNNNSRPTTSGSGTSRPKSSHTPKIEITDPNGAGMAKSSTGSPIVDGKLQKRVGRANSVSGGTIRRRKSLGSVKSTTSSRGGSEREPTPQVPAIQTDMKKVRRSPSLGSAAAGGAGAGGGGNPPVPPLPAAGGPQTPTRTHIFHMHKGVKAPHALNGMQQQADSITVSVEDASHTTAGQALGSPTEPTSRTILPRTNRLFPLVTRTPEPVLSEQSERDKFLACLRRIWLFISALYRRGGFFDEALQAIDEAAKIKTVNETGEADVLTERGYLVLEQGKKEEALVFFETVLGWDWDHPGGVVGLCRVVLEEGGEEKQGKVIPPIATGSQVRLGAQRNTVALDPRRESIYATPAQSPLLLKSGTFSPPTPSAGDSLTSPSTATANKPPPPPAATTPTTSTSDDDEGDLAPIIARNRAYGLLSQLTKSGRGWDCSEAWFALARSYEEDGMVEKAMGVYWWCVGLEDTRPVRGWGGVGGGGGGSGRGWGGRVV